MNDKQAIAAENYYTGTRAELRPYIPANHSRVLEIGCGHGGFRANLSPQAEVWGIEPVAEVAEVARGRLHRVLTGTFEQVAHELPDGYFDLVICNDVIEHMPDDSAFLKAIQKKMSSNGSLIGSIPNMRNWPILRALIFKKDWEYQDSGVLDRTHLRFYTIYSFPRLLRSAGFEVMQFNGINRTVRLRNVFSRLLFRTPWLNDTRWLQFAFAARLDPNAKR